MIDGRALAALPLFSSAPFEVLDEIAGVGHQRSLAPGQSLVREGDPGDDVMVVLEGTAAVVVGGVSVGTIGPGDCVGEMALLGNSPRSATVTAESPLRVLVVPAAPFSAILERAPALVHHLAADLVVRLRRSQEAWAGLAGDPEVLLAALLRLQDSPDPGVAERARRQATALVESAASRFRADAPDPLTDLSKAERRVAELVADGLSNQRIAESLYLSRHTVDSHLKRIFAKLGLHSRVELAALVVRGR